MGQQRRLTRLREEVHAIAGATRRTLAWNIDGIPADAALRNRRRSCCARYASLNARTRIDPGLYDSRARAIALGMGRDERGNAHAGRRQAQAKRDQRHGSRAGLWHSIHARNCSALETPAGPLAN